MVRAANWRARQQFETLASLAAYGVGEIQWQQACIHARKGSNPNNRKFIHRHCDSLGIDRLGASSEPKKTAEQRAAEEAAEAQVLSISRARADKYRAEKAAKEAAELVNGGSDSS